MASCDVGVGVGEAAARSLGSTRQVFRAVAVTVVPQAVGLDRAGWRELEGIVGEALSRRPRSLSRQLRWFLRGLDWFALFHFGRRFGALDPLLRCRVLGQLQESPLLLLRRGFWGLKTLVLMGYYGRGEAAKGIGYRASVMGRAGRRPRGTP